MDRKLAAERIDFADSEYRSFSMSEDHVLTIYMKNWEEKPLTLTFSHVIYFEYNTGDVPKDLYEVTSESALLDQIILRRYRKKTQQHPYKLFLLEDIYDFPFIKIVAESVEVIKGDFENV